VLTDMYHTGWGVVTLFYMW